MQKYILQTSLISGPSFATTNERIYWGRLVLQKVAATYRKQLAEENLGGSVRAID